MTFMRFRDLSVTAAILSRANMDMRGGGYTGHPRQTWQQSRTYLEGGRGRGGGYKPCTFPLMDLITSGPCERCALICLSIDLARDSMTIGATIRGGLHTPADAICS